VQGSPEDLPEMTRREIEKLPYVPEALIPFDDSLVSLDLEGEPLTKISDDSPAYKAVKKMLADLNILS